MEIKHFRNYLPRRPERSEGSPALRTISKLGDPSSQAPRDDVRRIKRFQTKMKTFRLMPRREKQLFFVNFFLCGIARASINLLSYKRLAPYFGHFYRMTVASTLPTDTQIQRAILLRRSIKLAASYTPWNSSCLTQAMVAKFWCQRDGIPYFFFVGFAKKTDKPLGQDAHAWVTSGPIAITGGHCLHSHQVVMSYSNIIDV